MQEVVITGACGCIGRGEVTKKKGTLETNAYAGETIES